MFDRLWKLFLLSVRRKQRSPGAFLSYAHEDEQVVAGLAKELRESGVEVWFAPDDARIGERLTKSIQRAIRDANFFLVASTKHSINSSWVAKETAYALEHEGENSAIVPLIFGNHPLPSPLADHKGVDLRAHVYRAGVRELLDRLHGRMSRGYTPLGEFEDFLDSLPILDVALQSAVDSYLSECRARAWAARGTRRVDIPDIGAIERHVLEKQPDQAQRILKCLRKGRLPPALSESEMRQVRRWLRRGSPFTLAFAARAYENRHITMPALREVPKWYIHNMIKAWVSRGELDSEDAPSIDWLVRSLEAEELIVAWGNDRYFEAPDDDNRCFDLGRHFKSIGKAAYLFARDHPDRPHSNYPVDRLIVRIPGISGRT